MSALSSLRARRVRLAIASVALATTGALFLSGCTSSRSPAGPNALSSLGEIVSSPRLTEISGLAASRRSPDLLWAHNDSGDGPLLYALDASGNLRGIVRIEGATARDWEDMASFTLDGVAWLLIGDVGDNASTRTDAMLYLVREPDPAALHPTRELTVAPAARLPVRYSDGPRDCEALAVDPATRTIFLLSKRTLPVDLYTLPLTTDPIAAADTPPAERLVSLDLPQPSAVQMLTPTPAGRYGAQPTALDLAADGSVAAVLTYANVWLFPREPGETWATAFARYPVGLAPTRLFQAEALCFAADSRSVIFTTEGPNAPLVVRRIDD